MPALPRSEKGGGQRAFQRVRGGGVAGQEGSLGQLLPGHFWRERLGRWGAGHTGPGELPSYPLLSNLAAMISSSAQHVCETARLHLQHTMLIVPGFSVFGSLVLAGNVWHSMAILMRRCYLGRP